MTSLRIDHLHFTKVQADELLKQVRNQASRATSEKERSFLTAQEASQSARLADATDEYEKALNDGREGLCELVAHERCPRCAGSFFHVVTTNLASMARCPHCAHLYMPIALSQAADGSVVEGVVYR